MTEEKWLSCENPTEMWAALARPSRRVAALFAVACVRATPEARGRPLLLTAADAVERAADEGRWEEVGPLNDEASRLGHEAGPESAEHHWALASLRLTWAKTIDHYAVHVPFFMGKALAGTPGAAGLGARYAALLRDTAGKPGRNGRGKRMKAPTRAHTFPALRESHLTATVLALADGIYAEKAFDGMPALADALQEAGCEDDRVLSHCRGPEPHVRGCWVLDLVLGKL